MKKPTYIIPILPGAKDASCAPALSIGCNNWSYPDAPETVARLAFDGNDLLITFTCKEKNPHAVYTENYQDVYKDSCMECFLCFDPKTSPRYVNVETKSNGARICSRGPDRYERKRVLEQYGILPIVSAQKSEDEWNVNIRLTNDFVKTLFGITLKKGLEFTGNFYKCQQDGGKENFLSWAPIYTPKPDFHRPEFFGTLVIE